MRWIKSRSKYLNEAKIREVIFPKQAERVASKWGEKYLDYEEITPTDRIIQGKWKLSEEDKNKTLGYFFNCDMIELFTIFDNLPDKFVDIIGQSIKLELLKSDKLFTIFKDFNMKTPTIDQIAYIHDNIFRKLSLTETQASEMIQKDENGRPVKNEDGSMVKISKNVGDPIFTNNLVNINSFIEDYNKCYDGDKVDSSVFSDTNISNLRDMVKNDHNTEFKVDFEIFNKDIYLSISHNPKDILNMSISKFYSSCQQLYNGGWNEKVLGNVFDPNSIPAFLVFETPIFWGEEIISDQLPLSRMMIRNIETFDPTSEKKIFFDRAYPDRMKGVFDEMVEKYSGNIGNVPYDNNRPNYIYTPDIEPDDKLEDPYMDRLGIVQYTYIGVNTKSLNLNRNYDWSKCVISPKAKIKELVIETTDLPENLFKINLALDWVKFKYLTLNDLEVFKNIKSNSLSFDKCKFDYNILDSVSESLEKLQLVSCETSGYADFSKLKNLKELHLIYTIDSIDELDKLINNLNINKLCISTDLVKEKSDKEYIRSIRNKGIKVDLVGPRI